MLRYGRCFFFEKRGRAGRAVIRWYGRGFFLKNVDLTERNGDFSKRMQVLRKKWGYFKKIANSAKRIEIF